MDVLVSAVVLIVFIRAQSAQLNIHCRWLPVLAVLTVGVSLGLPMFLYMKELRVERLRLMVEQLKSQDNAAASSDARSIQ